MAAVSHISLSNAENGRTEDLAPVSAEIQKIYI